MKYSQIIPQLAPYVPQIQSPDIKDVRFIISVISGRAVETIGTSTKLLGLHDLKACPQHSTLHFHIFLSQLKQKGPPS